MKPQWILVIFLTLDTGTAFSNTGQAITITDLFNLFRFVDWQLTTGTMTVCVLGDYTFRRHPGLPVPGNIQGRQVVMIRPTSLAGIGRCDALFVSQSEHAGLACILATAQRYRLLTISDLPGFASRGGIIELGASGDSVSFSINSGMARLSGIYIQSDLLEIARRVTDGVESRNSSQIHSGCPSKSEQQRRYRKYCSH